ncbi:ABC transporter ATP-binding protein [Granulosicoccus antarcticus]|uniref:ABC transporter ATP-binding protein YtrB n=1 Tax=Granulosicoccus antarcticus IMCC3135 TaxID=1192854 RepID=A0A2Z2P2Y5_9GAMM|nr:ABC transporter ATP-binding protein [Granulosicoccus antarcticus]ASJ76708.1 ABC transporter ATP-binding protein YtrB [Granulosicoccus antarcticus IMCC3135]
MTYPLDLTNVHAGYGTKKERVEILKGATLHLDSGSINGLLGRNGSGKTTLIRVALGLMKSTEGSAELMGVTAWDCPNPVRERLGYVSQNLDYFPEATVDRCLGLVGSFYSNWDNAYIDELKDRWDVGEASIATLSVGQKQKVALLMALGHRPDLLILDEPVASLDPAARRSFLSTLVELNSDTNQTILLSSHITSDIERMCSHVAILHHGQILCHTKIDELKERLRVVEQGEVPLGGEVLLKKDGQLWVLLPEDELERNSYARAPGSLEDLFLELTQ